MSESARRGSLLVIFLTVFIDLLGFGIVLPLLPIYAEEFSVSASGIQLGLLMASFSAMQFVFAPLWGRISDKVGRRPVILIGLLGSVVFYALFGLATTWKSFTWLFLSRVGAGVAGATISTAQAYIADTTPVEKRSKGMALIGMAFGLGFTVGPLIGYLAVWSGAGEPGPLPGYVAAGLSAIALILACVRLPESLSKKESSTASRWLDLASWREAMTTRSIPSLLFTVFVSVFCIANFETTLSLLIKGQDDAPFHFSFEGVFLTYTYIGLVLALAQGFLVRRLSGRVSESRLAVTGGLMQLAGFGGVIAAVQGASVPGLLGALAVVVTGYGMLSPSLNALLSRRTDPARQGRVLGVGQSVSSLARIFGAALGIPLLKIHLALPFVTGAALMAGGVLLVLWATRMGTDYGGSLKT